MRRQDLLKKHRLEVENLSERLRRSNNSRDQAHRELSECLSDLARIKVWQTMVEMRPDGVIEFGCRFLVETGMNYLPVEALCREMARSFEHQIKRHPDLAPRMTAQGFYEEDCWRLRP
jgi:hypothetical protein